MYSYYRCEKSWRTWYLQFISSKRITTSVHNPKLNYIYMHCCLEETTFLKQICNLERYLTNTHSSLGRARGTRKFCYIIISNLSRNCRIRLIHRKSLKLNESKKFKVHQTYTISYIWRLQHRWEFSLCAG